MGFVVAAESLLLEDVTQASTVYLDACFLLTAMSPDDNRYDKVMDVLDHLADRGITWITNSHITNEVISNLYKMTILRAIEVYYELRVATPANRQRPLTAEQQSEIVNISTTQSIYNLAKSRDFITINRGRLQCNNIPSLVKFLKQIPAQRKLLRQYAVKAEELYRRFLTLLQDYGFTITFVPIDEEINDLAFAYTRLFGLDMSDALHLAISRWYDCDKLLTLDGDFEHGIYVEEEQSTTPSLLARNSAKVIIIHKVA
jgi:predicted nucleic acid-binding protein